MTAILAILGKAWPYVLCAMVAGYLTHRVIDVPRYETLEASLASYKAQEADKSADAQKVATDALQAQIATRLATEANNGKIISQLQNERDAAVADRDFARRLLAAAQAQSVADSRAVSKAADRPGTDGASAAQGSGSLAADLGDAAAECRIAIQRLTALQLEIGPQL